MPDRLPSGRVDEEAISDSRRRANDMAMRPLYRNFLGLNARTAWLLLIPFCAVRFILVLNANANVGAGYGLVPVVFIIMALLPFILMTREGRRQIGLVRPSRPVWLGVAIVAGALTCLFLAGVIFLLFGGGEGDAFAYIARTYPAVPDDPQGRLIMFMIVAAISMMFSPIGEEFFFRGLIHEGFRAQYGETKASLLDAAAFAFVHLSHFGLVWTLGGWLFLPGPAMVWIVGMFGAALVFSMARRRTGSIWGAVVAHAAFNLAMTAWIFLIII